MLLPIVLLPRPSVITNLVVATSIATGLAFGVAVGGVILLGAAAGRVR